MLLANGQLGASLATVLGADDGPRCVSVLLRNTSASLTETVLLKVAVDGGTARQLARAVLAPNEALLVRNLPLGPSDVLSGSTTDATTVDYLVTPGTRAAGVEVVSLDANGAIKQVNTGVSGNQSISGNLAVTGTLAVTGASTHTGLTTLGPLASTPATAQDVATGNTITLPTASCTKLLTATAGAATGVILTAGTTDGAELTLINTHATNAITFAAAGTSNVADGTSSSIAALTAMTLVWGATAARWFHTK